jgi:hypothetical protein
MNIKSRWRQTANKVIARVVKENPDLPEAELRNKISDAYPFGERAYHPYTIWLSAVNQYFTPKPAASRTTTKAQPVNENQISMFGD